MAGKSCGLGFSTGKDHGYLGHFRKPKFLKEGHNTVPQRRNNGRVVTGVSPTTPGMVTVSHRNKNGTAVAKSRAISDLSKKTVRRTIKAGGAAAAAVAAARPKLAKRIARRNPTVRTGGAY